VVASGIAYTILRPTFFTEIWLSPAVGFDATNATATIYGAGQNPISWISLGDVAEFAVCCRDNPEARNAILELGGPQALSPHGPRACQVPNQANVCARARDTHIGWMMPSSA